jgi:hypothetical protein
MAAMSAVAMAGMRSIRRTAGSRSAGRRESHELEQALAQRGERRVGVEARPGALAARERHVDDRADAPGPRRHHRDAVAQEDRLLDAVRDEDDRERGARRDARELLLQRHARLRVDRGERLVHEHDVGVVRERARDRDALLHAAGQLVRVLVLDAVEVRERQEMPRGLVALGARHAAAA